ncbi:MAG TPA: amino acid adenylation domain-containing protein [Thermoanaerobaculia bacterium]|jgi:amino acid adenylation domain-containing protein|nr:amino acid adenylation domain-containing protein [Thermoanaerobaculia bacterium]
MSDLAQRISGLSPERRHLLQRMLEQKRLAVAPAATEHPAPELFALVLDEDRRRLPEGIEDAYPLTRMQAAMLYHMDLEAEYPLYHNVDSYQLQGLFVPAVFQQAVQRVVSRHAVLRTSFDLTSFSEPLQLVHRHAELPVGVADLRALSPQEQQSAIDDYIEREKRRRFDPSKPPLLRFQVHLLDRDRFQFTLTEFHPILDGWSLQSTFKELLQRYFALLRGRDLPDSPQRLTFRDYVRLEREALASAEHERYWTGKLEGFTFADLPRWPLAARSFAGRPIRTVYLEVPESVFRGLKLIAQRERVPLKSLFLAVHMKILALLTGQRDVVAGLISHGRPEGITAEHVRGLFLNTVPFRMEIPEGNWAELVRASFANEQEFMPFRRYPMPALQQKLGRRLFETEFNLTHFHVYQDLDEDDGIDLRLLGSRELEETSFPLNVAFSLDPAAARLRLIFLYHRRELADSQMQAIVGYYRTALGRMAAHPDGRHAVSLLAEAERHQIVMEWNDSLAQHGSDLLFDELFQAQAARTPEAVAVVAPEGALTYAELDRRADRLAGWLALRGIGAESVVALLAPRGIDFLTAVLAVFRAGGAYLPLHPAHPSRRHREVLEGGRVGLVLVAGEFESRVVPAIADLPSGARPALERLEEALLIDGDGPCRCGAGANLAYVIFTSGSTGRPKGAMVEQRGMLNHLLTKIGELHLTGADTVAQTASQCFDISVWQLLAALLVGGRVTIVDDEVAHDPVGLLDEIGPSGTTVLETVPSLLAAMVEEAEKRWTARPGLAALRWMIPTGEALPPSLCQRWLALYPQIPLLNAYGPTECSDDVTHHRIDDAPGDEVARIPIGRPIPNMRLHVLDGDLQPVPIGVAGELYVGGVGVGRGYIGDPERTAQAFVPDPLAAEPGERLYRTGDLARCLPQGEIEFLGRVDHQVKIRGYRIEPGEIESTLSRHLRVREAIVLALPAGEGGELRLVAYLAVGEQEPPAAPEMRALLRETLPDYMVPAVFVPLPAFPLNASGKVDRLALPAPGAAPEEVPSDADLPNSPVEEILAGIWGRLLGIERVRRRDDFFEIGGHSLSATQLISRVRDSFRVELSLRVLLEDPTLAGQAARIERALRSGQGAVSLPLGPVDRDGELPLSFSQERLWFLTQIDPANAAFNVPAAFRVRGKLDPSVLALALSEVVRRHESLRTAFLAVGGRPAQAIAPPAPLALAIADLEGIPPDLREPEVRRLATEEARRPFDLALPPLMRACLLRLGEEEHVLLFTIHHIVSDGWSMGVLVKEATALYEAFAAGRLSPLPDLPLQYADFAFWQRRWMEEAVLEEQLAHWRRQLAGAPDLLELPADRPRPKVRTFRGAYYHFQLPAGLSRELGALSRRHGTTLFMALLAAFQTFLHALTDQRDVVVGTDVANRNRTELEGQIGFFINHLVLRTVFSGNPTFGELLEQVRNTCLGAYAHQDLPFVRLVKELSPKRSLSHMPLFQVLFVVQNAPVADLEISGLHFQPIAFDFEVSRFDLALFVNESEQGLVTTWNYSTELFDCSTIERFARLWQRLLEELAAQPDARLDRLELVVQTEREPEIVETKQQESPFKRLKTAQRRSVDLSGLNPVRSRSLVAGQSLPLLVEPADTEVDLASWAESHRGDLDAWLASHGAILFRGFGLYSVAEFERCAAAICPNLFGDYGDLPREHGVEKVYHSTPYPQDKWILFHNESSHLDRWPMRQMFFCVEAAQSGGETPVVDCRDVYRRLDPALVRRFEDKGLMYVRNFTDGLDVNWRDFFHTDDRDKVEEMCRFAGMEFEWREDGLTTRQVCPAVLEHPRTGEKIFFNQIQLHHPACLDPELRESLFAVFAEERLPRNVHYGDGTPIEEPVVRDILETYWQASVSFPWQAGDLLLLDNMLVAHARNPFVGPRKIVVAMGDLYEHRVS